VVGGDGDEEMIGVGGGKEEGGGHVSVYGSYMAGGGRKGVRGEGWGWVRRREGGG